MAKFVWELSSRGAWAPQLFHGELPREMTMPHNAGRYVTHEISRSTMRRADEARDRGGSALAYLAVVFPPRPHSLERKARAMSLKSILRALGLARPFSGPQALGDAIKSVTPQATPFLDRLTSRRDWSGGTPLDHARLIDPNFPNPPAWIQAMKSDPWPATDDPYAKPEPCDVVPDPALVKLSDRGLTGPIGTNAGLERVMDLIERQEAAERELIIRGMAWSKENKRWYDPDTELA